jgi:hypothetical protein
MYMRLLGYPAEKITILTTYNGQKALIRDVINTRCAVNPWIGEPHKVCWNLEPHSQALGLIWRDLLLLPISISGLDCR